MDVSMSGQKKQNLLRKYIICIGTYRAYSLIGIV